MKIIFKKCAVEENHCKKEKLLPQNNNIIKSLLSSLQTIKKDLDDHLNKDNENNENI